MPGPEVVDLGAAGDPVAALLDASGRAASIAVSSSGSTGTARRIVRTAASWVDSFPVVRDLVGLTGQSRVWVPGPLQATANLYAACLARWTGAAAAGSAESATHAFLTPYALTRLLDNPEPRRLVVVAAGDRLPPDLADRASARGWRVHHYYGAAELSFVAWGRDTESLRPFPQVAVESRAGELWVRSPWLCERVESPAGLTSTYRRQGPWATVGDRGTVTAGTVRVTGRAGVVITGGATVVVADVEAVLRPAATGDVLVLGLPHAGLGALLAAVCTEPADVPRLRDLARSGLGASHRPRRWLVCPDPPRTPAGKLDRAALAARFAGAGS